MEPLPTQAMLGAAVRYARESQGLALDELSTRAGVSTAYLDGLEDGRRNPTWKSVAALAAGLRMQTSVLVALAEQAPVQEGRA